MKTEIQAAVDQWLSWDRDESTRAEINALVEKGDEKTLERLLGSRMAFGTAGLRSRMGAGFREIGINFLSRKLSKLLVKKVLSYFFSFQNQNVVFQPKFCNSHSKNLKNCFPQKKVK